MTAKEVFALTIRLAGMLMLVWGAFAIFHLALHAIGFGSASPYPVPVAMAAAILWLSLAVGFVLGAPLITKLAYLTDR